MTKLTWQQQEGDGGVVGVLLLVLGPGIVEDGKEGEVTSVAPVATNDEQGAEVGEQDGEDDVEEVETWTHPVVEGEQLAAGAQGVASLDLSEWPFQFKITTILGFKYPES